MVDKNQANRFMNEYSMLSPSEHMSTSQLSGKPLKVGKTLYDSKEEADMKAIIVGAKTILKNPKH